MITVKDHIISSQFYLRNDNKERNRESLRSFSILSTGTATTMPPLNALSFLGRCTAFSVFDPLESAVLPVIAHWTVELRDHGYPAHALNKPIKSLSNTIITHTLRGSISRLVTSIYNDPTFDLTVPFELRVKVTNDGYK
jgi:hypothetical protein